MAAGVAAMRVALIAKALVSVTLLLWCLSGLTLGIYSYVYASEQAEMPDQELVIDDRRQADLTSALGTRWRLVSDQVMGGSGTRSE